MLKKSWKRTSQQEHEVIRVSYNHASETDCTKPSLLPMLCTERNKHPFYRMINANQGFLTNICCMHVTYNLLFDRSMKL